ncbi:MAG: rhomboid family intramembrane serine protease [Candidatus Pacebacteria bacterium]|nr:rhomboid family intramembrane serine protease [Candidatus Paceibacterota bacterium]MDD2757157.1 rhomboid family intramembrane serine protease [Candidatus Paceibacterota bacterium]MDD3283671.1 rhomboid family intramembrane serine protease [Candidatus Paceibacterota bacterium]MDD3969705.1 rhomboid family intramembrane serine protease [Candidatus Paceibacterota bacterium]MDD4737699.1 rhomboid family intramembrane serine protease [Candidatus Paceibacterota bacterium]
MLPLYDKIKVRSGVPWGIIFLVLINSFIFFISPDTSFFSFSLENIWNGMLFTLITSLFLHGSFLHLLVNMWFLWVFGINIEMRLGTFKFLLFYLLCGIIGSILFTLSTPAMVIGASASIAGLLGGYLVLFPKNKIKALLPPIYFPAAIYIFIWFLLQIFSVSQMEISTAYLAHVGGFIAGIILIKKI